MGYFPVDARARMTLGLRSLDLADWFELDEQRPAELLAKEVLLAERRPEVVAQLPTGKEGAAELAELATAWLLGQKPDDFQLDGSGICDRELARTVLPDAESPLVQIARLVQEDIVVMSPIAEDWQLTAAVVCSPSRWALADKVGRGLAGIHAPVPEYAEQIGQPVHAMFDKILPERPMWRANWTLLDDPALFQPATAQPRPLAADRELGDLLFFRVERQTIRKLPSTGAVAFTIRTYVRSLSAVVAEEPAAAELLTDALTATTPAHADYRGWQEIRPQVLAWLDSR